MHEVNRGERHGDLRSNILGGVTTAAVMLTVEGSYGLIALRELGPAFASFAFLCAIASTTVANLVCAATAPRGPLLTAPSAALALLVPPLMATLALDPRVLGADGRPEPAILLAFLSIGVMLAGLLQCAAAALRIGGVVRYVPYPVLAGFLNGAAVLMCIAILPYALGHAGLLSAGRQGLAGTLPLSAVVALVTVWLAARPPRFLQRVPRYLLGFAVGTATYYLLLAVAGPAQLGGTLGPVQFDGFGPDRVEPALRIFREGWWLDHWRSVAEFAGAIALLSSLQSMLASSVVDGLTRERRDSERQLLSQGLANSVLGMLGGLPVASSVARTVLNIDSGGIGRASVVAYGAMLLAVITLGAPLLQYLPLAVVAGLFMVAAWGMVDPWSRQSVPTLIGAMGGRPVPRTALLNIGVMLLVTAVCVGASIMHGVAIGVLLSMLAFVRQNSRHPVRAVMHGHQRRSLKVRTAATLAVLREHGERITVVELDGALFFGTADTVAEEIDRTTRGAQVVIVDFRRVTEVDASGARVLLQAADMLRLRGARMLLASIAPDGPHWREILAMDVHGVFRPEDLMPDTDRALELAEDRLLASLALPSEDVRGTLRLEDTMLGTGLDADELQVLSSLLTEHRIAAGTAIFRQGEESDALYVSLSGEVGIWIRNTAHTATGPDGSAGPGAHRTRRIVSFDAGVVFGEIGLLQSQPRSADAVAEDDVVLLALSRPSLDRLAREHHRLLGRLMLNLTLHLSGRVRSLTDDLQSSLDLR